MSGQLELAPISTPTQRGQRQVSDTMAEFISAARSPNTLRAYYRIWDGRQKPELPPPNPPEGFVGWCREHGLNPFPADEYTFGEWITSLCARGLAPPTIEQAMAAVRTIHRVAGYKDLPPSRAAHEAFRGYRRKRAEAGAPPPKQAPPATVRALRAMIDTCDLAKPIGVRDHFLLVLGFGLMARRSELAALLMQDITESDGGLDVLIRKSKTDQDAEGAWVAVPRSVSPNTDPVVSFHRWRDVLTSHGITEGPLFRNITKAGAIGKKLSADAISQIVRNRARAADLPHWQAYTAHSLRAGGLTAALEAGRPLGIVTEHGRWSPASPVVHTYARRARRWEDNAMRGVW